MLARLLEAYARGETDAQHALLDEVEPLLFGFLRSLLPSGADSRDRALGATHALVLAFHLRACAGRVAVAESVALKAYAHRMASTRLRDPEPLRLAPLADAETGSMVYKCFGLGLAIEEALSPEQTALFAERLAGRPLAELKTRDLWPETRAALHRAGLLAR